MPIPQGLGWFSPSNYPRCLYFKSVPELPPPDDTDAVEEVRRGWVVRGESARVLAEPPLIHRPDRAKLPRGGLDHRLANGASPGLAVPRLAGNERIQLRGLTRDGALDLQLPGERPAVAICFEGRPIYVDMSLHTVLVEPDAARLSLVWGARAPVPRSNALREGRLEALEVRVDGAVVSHELVAPTSPTHSPERPPC